MGGGGSELICFEWVRMLSVISSPVSDRLSQPRNLFKVKAGENSLGLLTCIIPLPFKLYLGEGWWWL